MVQPQAYEELPELTDDMLARGKVNTGGRPRAANLERRISIRLTRSAPK